MKSILYTKFFDKEIKEKVDVVLSPEFYWIKKIDIPIKSLKDAKKIAKTVFKLQKERYVFDAFELNGKFFAVAFEKELKINIPPQFINSVRIAQIEFFDYDCIKIDDSHAIKKIDDLLFCFPENVECERAEKILQNKKLSNKKFNLINRLEIDKSIIILITLIFLMVNAGFILNIVSLKKTLKNCKPKKRNFSQKQIFPKHLFS